MRPVSSGGLTSSGADDDLEPSSVGSGADRRSDVADGLCVDVHSTNTDIESRGTSGKF